MEEEREESQPGQAGQGVAGSRAASLKSRLPALLFALYLFSYWALPQGWNEDNPLDGSWRYALGRFRELGFSLGRDSWFTYGPLAHWFGAPMGDERLHPLPYYLLGLFVAGSIGHYLNRIFDLLALSFRARLATALLLPLAFLSLEGSHEVQLVLALFLLLVSCSLERKPALPALAALVPLAACGLLYKISFGMMALFVLVVLLLSLLLRREIGARTATLALAGYLLLLYALFVLSSGSRDLFSYLSLGLETAGKYSEIMILNLPFSPPCYLIALFYLALGAVLAWQAGKEMAGRGAALCLIMALSGALLLLFKHGFVRADAAHMRLFYGCVTPVLAILALVALARFRSKGKGERVLLCSVSLLLVLVYAVMLKVLPGHASPVQLPGNWLTLGNRLATAARGQDPAEHRAKRAFIRASHPELFSRLNQAGQAFAQAAPGRKPRIAFYPWELMFFEAVDGFELAPSPSLQLYASGPHSRVHRLEVEFLSSARRPDFVLLGPAAIDRRSAVSELSDLLPPLWSYYRLVDVVEGYAILQANPAGQSSGREPRYAATPQGAPATLLRLTLDRPGTVNGVFWRLAATLFKAPELNVALTVTHADGQRLEYLWRGYLGQLQRGVLFTPQELPELLAASFAGADAPPGPAALTGAVAEVRRSDGFWNLTVIPKVVPLKVEYVSVR